MKEIGVHKGFGQKTSDWLVIPLHIDYHIGSLGIDGNLGATAWEASFGRQVNHLDDLCRAVGYNVWLRAGVPRELEGLC